MNKRKNIPANVLRTVRKKCKFGCVICGCPIYDKDHLTKDYALYHEHIESDLFLLCPNHHREKTNKLISTEYIKECYEKLNRNTTKSQSIYLNDFNLILGNNTVLHYPGMLFNILDRDYFSLQYENDIYLINCKIYNKNNILAFEIKNNEYSCNNEIWDIKYQGNKFFFSNKLYDVFLNIKINAIKKYIKINGKFYLNNNDYIWIKDDGIFFNGRLLISECISKVNFNNIGFYIYNGSKKNITGSWGFGNSFGISKSRGNGFIWNINCLLNH